MSTTSPSRQPEIARDASLSIAPNAALIRSPWNAGIRISRARSWYSPSVVRRPSPSSGISSPMLPSRQRKLSRSETVIRWFAAGPIMNTSTACSTRIENTGPYSS